MLHVILLCGIPGSGKTALAHRLIEICPSLIRINQDELGDRQRCEYAVLEHIAQQIIQSHSRKSPVTLPLLEGKSESKQPPPLDWPANITSGDLDLTFVIDRCNFDERQRMTWISIAHAFNGRASAITLEVPFDECSRRIQHRVDHPAQVHGEAGVKVLQQYFRNSWRHPRLSEGLSHIFQLYNPNIGYLQSTGFERDFMRKILQPPDIITPTNTDRDLAPNIDHANNRQVFLEKISQWHAKVQQIIIS